MKDKLRKGSNAGLSLVKEMYEFWNRNSFPRKSYHEFSDILAENNEVVGTKVKAFLALIEHKFEH